MDFNENIPNPVNRINSTGINKIFTGAIFIFLSFRFNGFDVIPDFIGYLFILSGLNMLTEYSRLFQKAKIFALISLFLSFGDIYQVNYNIGEVPRWLVYYTPTIGLASLAIHIALYYCIIYGIVNMAENANNKDISYQGGKVFKLLYIVNFANFAVTLLVLFAGSIMSFTTALMIGVIVFAVIIQIAYLVFLRKSYNSLSNAEIIINNEYYGYKVKKIGIAFISCLLSLAVMCAGCYFYIEKTYLFTPFNYPPALQSQLQLDLSSFRKPARMEFQISEHDDFTNAAFEAQNQNDIDNTTKQLIIMLGAVIERSPTHYTNDENNFFGFGGFYGDYDNEVEQEAIDAKRYKIIVSFESNIINFEINDKSNILEANGKQFILNDDDWNELFNYVEKTFAIN